MVAELKLGLGKLNQYKKIRIKLLSCNYLGIYIMYPIMNKRALVEKSNKMSSLI